MSRTMPGCVTRHTRHASVTHCSPILGKVVEVTLVTSPKHVVMVHLIHLVRMPPTISNHLPLHPPTLRCHSDAHCISSHNHTTPVTGLNSDQCLIDLDFVPMSRATTYLSFSPYAAFA